MTDHRIRLTDDDIALIVSALNARSAMATGKRLEQIRRLVGRLGESGAGNPRWRLGAPRCIHEVPLNERCERCRARNRERLPFGTMLG